MTTPSNAAGPRPAERLPIEPRAPTNKRRRARLLILIEGRHDVEFLRRSSRIFHTTHSELPSLAEEEQAGRVVFLPTGGGGAGAVGPGLATLGCPEFHLYDREVPPLTQQRLATIAAINRRPHCQAGLTSRRSLENYLHSDAIREAANLSLAFTGTDDVPEIAARAEFIRRCGEPTWRGLSNRARRRLRERAKIWLNSTAVDRMTSARWAEADPAGEVAGWLATIAKLVADLS